jgi:hypothetical protein
LHLRPQLYQKAFIKPFANRCPASFKALSRIFQPEKRRGFTIVLNQNFLVSLDGLNSEKTRKTLRKTEQSKLLNNQRE